MTDRVPGPRNRRLLAHPARTGGAELRGTARVLSETVAAEEVPDRGAPVLSEA